MKHSNRCASVFFGVLLGAGLWAAGCNKAEKVSDNSDTSVPDSQTDSQTSVSGGTGTSFPENTDNTSTSDPSDSSDSADTGDTGDSVTTEGPYSPDCAALAIAGGPCTTLYNECAGDDACAALITCVTDTYDQPDGACLQTDCFEQAGDAATEKYWAYQKCVYCEECPGAYFETPLSAPIRGECETTPKPVACASQSDINESQAACDGENADCYSECWNCAVESNACRPALENCLSDDGCLAYYSCKEELCCRGTGNQNDCLTGEQWEDCMATCRSSSNVSDASITLYREIDQCVACDVCVVSCGINEASVFAMCADADKINTACTPCYQNEIEDDSQTACFSWAGWGGPCTVATQACKTDESCADLETCINEAWEFCDWESRREACFEEFGTEAETLYWAYLQCIYCDACSQSCAADAAFAHCDTYQPE